MRQWVKYTSRSFFSGGGWDGGHLDKPSIVKIKYNTDRKNETPSTIQKAKFVYLVLFVKKGPCFIASKSENLRNHILFLKKRSIEYRDFYSKN